VAGVYCRRTNPPNADATVLLTFRSAVDVHAPAAVRALAAVRAPAADRLTATAAGFGVTVCL
jgi:hypothetical protein